MDTSAEYVKMCDCPEIQGGHQWERGDFVVPVKPSPSTCDKVLALDGYAVPKRRGTLGWYIPECEVGIDSERFIWLPRQDQLQETVDWKKMDIVRLTFTSGPPSLVIQWDVSRELVLTVTNPLSLEQAWLMLVMHEKFGKHWNGEAWA